MIKDDERIDVVNEDIKLIQKDHARNQTRHHDNGYKIPPTNPHFLKFSAVFTARITARIHCVRKFVRTAERTY